MKKGIKITLITIISIVGLFVVVVGSYVGYVFFQYNRIDDVFTLKVNSKASEKTVMVGQTYNIATYNIGFGAYSPDFDFFLDSGIMQDGKKVTGHRGTAIDKEHVETNLNGVGEVLKGLDLDFAFLQEVDKDGDRSYHMNQVNFMENQLNSYDSVYAENFHSAYLFYPFLDPHGKTNAGIMTFSKYQIQAATRYSFSISTGFDKFFDLDRCFSVSELSVDNGKKLILLNLHMSAYDKGGYIREKQMKELSTFLEEMEREGNYVIAGGDFNHDLLTNNPAYLDYSQDNLPFKDETKQQKPDWLAFFFNEKKESGLPKGYTVIASDNTSSCRAAEMPWEKGVNYVTVVDGFIVSSNIEVELHYNVETNYAYSDHQPAYMEFKLL